VGRIGLIRLKDFAMAPLQEWATRTAGLQPEVTVMQDVPSQTEEPSGAGETTLTISPEKVSFIIEKAREFDVKDEATEPDAGSNPSDGQYAAVLEDHDGDPVVEEL
jgi:hypothetical protein